MRAAVIDIGTSSIKLMIGEDEGGRLRIVQTLKNLADIGKSTFYRGRISQSIINQTVGILNNYKKVIEEYSVAQIKVIATTAVREAINKDIFVDAVLRKTGLEIEIFNVGDVVYYIDSFLSYKLDKAYPIHEKNLLIAELGAGNLDVSLMEKGFTLMNIGVPIGTMRLKQFKNKINASQQDTYEALQEYIENEMATLKRAFLDFKIDDVILIDESYSIAIQRVLEEKKRETNFFKFSSRESKQFVHRITEGNLDDLAHEYNIPTDIADSVDGYAFILNNIFKIVRNRSIYILETSLMEALLANIVLGVEIANKYNKSNQLISVAKFLCEKFEADLKHAKQVAGLCEQLFGKLKDMLGLKEDELVYLLLAAYLHNIGLFINNRSHHKHTEYIVSSLNLFRLSDSEIKVIATIARYHRKNTPQRRHLLYGALPADKQILVQKLAAILRIANALDASHKQKVKGLEVNFRGQDEVELTVRSTESFFLEKSQFDDMKGLFEEVSGSKAFLKVVNALTP
jgi:exopolyphosphatase/guanosine-5'-triphosphate,3'-diphosphate pyrophosphatase